MNQAMQTLHSLRSIHGQFSDRSVSDEDLGRILQACVRAANASNRQSYSVVVVDDKETQMKLAGYQGSRLLLFCVDFTRLVDSAELLGHPYALEGFAPFLTGAIDTALVAQTAVVAAKALGIDSLLTNGIHRGDLSRTYDLLGLPKTYCFPLIALVLGYAVQEPEHLRGRLAGPGVIHWGTYRPATREQLQEIIRTYDDPSAHLGPSVPWREQGYGHFLDWFFQVWSRRQPSPEGRSQLFERLAESGFLRGELGS